MAQCSVSDSFMAEIGRMCEPASRCRRAADLASVSDATVAQHVSAAAGGLLFERLGDEGVWRGNVTEGKVNLRIAFVHQIERGQPRRHDFFRVRCLSKLA
jgi:hypothetical protein